MKWSSNTICRDKSDDPADQQSALESHSQSFDDDQKSSKPINSVDYSQQEHDPKSLKPIHREVFDEGGSISSKEKKMGVISKIGLALGVLALFASPILGISIILPILYSQKNSDDDKFSKHDRDDLTPDQIGDRLQRVEDIENAIANAKANQQSSETEKSPLSFEDEASNQPPQTNQLKKNPLINGKPKPILKKPQPQVSIDALDLALSKPILKKPQPQVSIDALDLASSQHKKPDSKAGNLAGDLAGIAKDLRGDPRPPADQAGAQKGQGKVRFGPNIVHEI